MNAFDFQSPANLEETFTLLEEHGEEARLISGGTALLLLMRQQLVRPDCLVHLGQLETLKGLEQGPDSLFVGALTTHRELETSPLVTRSFPALAETLRHVATIRIRNMATLGGNLAHADPALDPPVTLMALDASVHLVSREGTRVVPLDQFFSDYFETVIEPKEVLAKIEIPWLAPRTSAVFLKFLPRSADDYATVAVAARLSLDESGQLCQDVRLALGSVGTTTIRAREAEEVLRGQPVTPSAFQQAAELAKSAADPIADVRGSARYKRDMAGVFVHRALNRCYQELEGQMGAEAG